MMTRGAVNQIISFIVYVALGLAIHLLIYGEPDWNLTFTYVFAILWPFVVAYYFLFYFLILVAVILVIGVIYVLVTSVSINLSAFVQRWRK